HALVQRGRPGGDAQRLAVRARAARGHRLLQPGAHLANDVLVAADQHRELVATPSEAAFRQPHLGAQRRAHLAQAVVARQVSVAVVDLLEAVQVAEQQAQLAALARDARRLVRERLLERAAIAQSGERVDPRQLGGPRVLALKIGASLAQAPYQAEDEQRGAGPE